MNFKLLFIFSGIVLSQFNVLITLQTTATKYQLLTIQYTDSQRIPIKNCCCEHIKNQTGKISIIMIKSVMHRQLNKTYRKIEVQRLYASVLTPVFFKNIITIDYIAAQLACKS